MKNENLFKKLKKHKYIPILGATGSGRTTLLKVLFSQRILNGGGAMLILDRGLSDLEGFYNICIQHRRKDDVIILDFSNDLNAKNIEIDIVDIIKKNKIIIINYNERIEEISKIAKTKIRNFLIQANNNLESPTNPFTFFLDKSWKFEKEEIIEIPDFLEFLEVKNIYCVVCAYQDNYSNLVFDDENIVIFLRINSSKLNEELNLICQSLNPGQGYINSKAKFEFERL